MRIISSRLDDVRLEKEEYERDYEAKKAAYDEQSAAYSRASRAILDNIQSALLQQIQARTSQEVRVEASRDYSWKNPDESLIQVRVYAQDPGWPLRWTWYANVDPVTGEVVKDSNSYSGIEATTPEDINKLKESLSVMDYLVNDVDWNTLLHVQLPNRSDYFTMERPEQKNFATKEKQALIEDCIGQPILVKCTVVGERYTSDQWVKFLAQSNSFYTIMTIAGASKSPEDVVDRYEEFSRYSYSQRIRKDKVYPVTPFETVEIPE